MICMMHKSYKAMAASAMFAAMIALTTAYLFHIPIGSSGGYIHFGDAFIYLAASMLPLPYACAAAALGGGLADLISGAAIWILPTVIIKPLTAIWFTCAGKRLLCGRNVFALAAASFVSILGYYVAEALMIGNWLAPLATLWGGVIQAGGSAALYALAAAGLDRAGVRDRLHFKEGGATH